MKFPSIDHKSFRAIVFDPSVSLTAETCPVVFEDHHALYSVRGNPGLEIKLTVPFAIGDGTSFVFEHGF